MKFSEIKHKIKNLGYFKSLKEIKDAGLRIVKNSKTGDYWLIEARLLQPISSPIHEFVEFSGYIHDNNTGDEFPEVLFIKSIKNLSN